jgi:membrane protein implicated in regulation of membrane protease activity
LKNSTILFLAAVVFLIWFGAEAYPGKEICVTSCVSLSGLNYPEIAVVVLILPVLLVIFGIRLRAVEKKLASQQSSQKN